VLHCSGRLAVSLVLVALIVLVGSFLQANIGFGFPIVAMIFFPSLFPFSTAVTLNQVIAIASTLFVSIRYRTYIRWRILLPLLLSSLLVAQLVIVYSLSIDTSYLTVVLGLFLVLLSLYFARFSEKIHIQPTVANGFLMGLVAGIGNGFFGIGGPPVALYLFAAATEKKSYLATIQAYFLFCNLHSILVRSLHGSLLVSHIPIILVGWVSIAIGTIAGLKLFTKIPEYFLKRIVYAFVGLSGLWIALQQLF